MPLLRCPVHLGVPRGLQGPMSVFDALLAESFSICNGAVAYKMHTAEGGKAKCGSIMRIASYGAFK